MNIEKKIRNMLLEIKESREEAKFWSAKVSSMQTDAINTMFEVDPDGYGIVVDNSDKGTAYVQQNNPTESWDQDKILDWLSHPKRVRLKNSATSRVFDVNKWEALVASKEVSAKDAEKFLVTGKPPKPFIRFGKKGEKSL